MREKIIVTGSNGQLGKEISRLLVSRGFEVLGIDLSHDSENYTFYTKVELDITSECDVKSFFDHLVGDENIVGLVNNAGVAVFTPFSERTTAEINSVLNVNVTACILMAQQFMKATVSCKRQRRLVNIASIYGHVAPDLTMYEDTPRMSSEIYGMTKAAIINFTQYLASYYSGCNARFNCVSPGGIEFQQGPEFKRKYSSKVPLMRMASETEISEVIHFLLSDKSSYINGENIFVDGGLTKW